MRYNVLHIAVHLGGGIGSVVSNWIRSDTKNRHMVICLNENYYNKYDDLTIFEGMRHKYIDISRLIRWADIVVVHFWNHPMLFEFLINMDLPYTRLCFWSHVSGLQPPYVFSEKLIDFADKFVFTSPISFKAKEIAALSTEQSKKLGHVWSTAYISGYFNIKPTPHEGFNIGFIGTLDYSKLHPNFVDFCSKINIPDVKFIMIGDGCDKKKIKQQTRDKGIRSKFVFTGVIEDIRPWLEIIDVLGYPLNPDHFGTCEQVLGEAIAAGVIPIVMRNPAEEYILFQSLIRFVCNDEQEYVHNMELLYRDRNRRTGIATLIQEQVTKLYDSEAMVASWEKVFNDLMETDKRMRVWPVAVEHAKSWGFRIFIESLGDYGIAFENNSVTDIRELLNSNLQWKSASKGSPKQYLETFPGDDALKNWVDLIEGE